MHASLQKLFERLEYQREVTVAPFRSIVTEQFNQSPRAGKWSAAEILSHILTAERLSVMYMKKKMLGIDQLPRSGVWEAIKIAVLIASQRMPGLKFRAPRRVVENTIHHTSLPEIEKTWKEIRNDLHNLLDRIPPGRIDRKIYKDPAAGYLDARHALVFFREHVIHHTPQLRKLLSQNATPTL